MLPSKPRISDRITHIARLVDSGAWRTSRIPAYRIISECESLLECPWIVSTLTDAERQWLIGVVVWVSETLEDSARGEGVYME